jgi:hypothetical protein
MPNNADEDRCAGRIRAKAIRYVLPAVFGVLLMIFCMCRSNEFYRIPDSEMTENDRIFGRQLRKISRGEYGMDDSFFCGRFYYIFYRRPSSPPERAGYYIELPKLPGGLFFQYRYNRAEDRWGPFPGLEQLNPKRPSLYLMTISIKETYIYEDYIVIRAADEKRFIRIFFEQAPTFDFIESPDGGYKMKYTFYENLFSSEDLNFAMVGMRRLIKRTGDFDPNAGMSVLRGIISAGIVYIDSEPFIAGETICCLFSYSLISEELVFYNDTNSFNAFISKTNKPGKYAPLSFGYYEALDKMFEGREIIRYYDVTYSVTD